MLNESKVQRCQGGRLSADASFGSCIANSLTQHVDVKFIVKCIVSVTMNLHLYSWPNWRSSVIVLEL